MSIAIENGSPLGISDAEATRLERILDLRRNLRAATEELDRLEIARGGRIEALRRSVVTMQGQIADLTKQVAA